MRKFLLIIALCLITPSIAIGQTFHAIIFANTKSPGNPNRPGDTGIGPSVTVDFERMSIEMTTIAKSIGYSIKKYYYYGTQQSFNRRNLEAVLNNLICAPNDIVYFYYSGHGGRAMNEKSEFPEMVLRVPYGAASDSELYPLYDVYNRIQKKSPRLTIVMGDLCNSTIKGYYRNENNASRGATVLSKSSFDLYKNLFLNVKGGFIVSSSKPSVTSTCIQTIDNKELGGNFTHNFLETLQTCVAYDIDVSWDKLFDEVAKKTRKFNVIDDKGNTVPQDPVYKLFLTTAPINNNNFDASALVVPLTSNDDATNQRDQLAYSLSKVCNRDIAKIDRIHNIKEAKALFSDANARVQVVGFDNNTIVNTCSANSYLNYLSIATNMAQVVVINTEKDNAGKVKYVKVHEIHYK